MATITKTIKPSGGDYTSLSAWEAGQQADLVTAGNIEVAECYSMSDTTVVVVGGWTTDATNYIRIYTPTAERHDGKWNTAKYRLEPSAQYDYPLIVTQAYTRVEGLQVRRTWTGSGDTRPIIYGNTAGVEISYCICTSAGVASGGINFGSSSSASKVYNNLVYGVSTNGIYGFGNATIYSNTVQGCGGAGISKSAGDSGTTWTLKNNLVDGSTGADFENLSGTFTVTYCASSDATANDWAGTGNRINQTFTFVDSAGKDFHLTSGDVGALDFGTDLSADATIAFSDDIDGEARGVTWDIGADEYVAVGGATILIVGSTSGLSTLSASAILTLSAVGTITGASTVTGLVAVDRKIIGTVVATSALTAGLKATYGVAGAIPALSTITGALTGILSLTGNIAGLSTLSATAGLTLSLAGSTAGLSSLSGTATVSAFVLLSGVVAGLSSLSGQAVAVYGAVGSVTGTSGLTGNGTVNYNIIGQSAGVSVLSATAIIIGAPTTGQIFFDLTAIAQSGIDAVGITLPTITNASIAMAGLTDISIII